MSGEVLYRFYDIDDNLLYVGITNTWYQRFHDHERKSGWFSKVAYSTFEWHDSRDSVREAELLAITKENPEFNKANNPSYETVMDHFQKLKIWTFSDSVPDQAHLDLVTEMKENLRLIGKTKQSKWIAMAFIDCYAYFGPKWQFDCRNCQAMFINRNVNIWHGDAYASLEKELCR